VNEKALKSGSTEGGGFGQCEKKALKVDTLNELD